VAWQPEHCVSCLRWRALRAPVFSSISTLWLCLRWRALRAALPSISPFVCVWSLFRWRCKLRDAPSHVSSIGLYTPPALIHLFIACVLCCVDSSQELWPIPGHSAQSRCALSSPDPAVVASQFPSRGGSPRAVFPTAPHDLLHQFPFASYSCRVSRASFYCANFTENSNSNFAVISAPLVASLRCVCVSVTCVRIATQHSITRESVSRTLNVRDRRDPYDPQLLLNGSRMLNDQKRQRGQNQHLATNRAMSAPTNAIHARRTSINTSQV